MLTNNLQLFLRIIKSHLTVGVRHFVNIVRLGILVIIWCVSIRKNCLPTASTQGNRAFYLRRRVCAPGRTVGHMLAKNRTRSIDPARADNVNGHRYRKHPAITERLYRSIWGLQLRLKSNEQRFTDKYSNVKVKKVLRPEYADRYFVTFNTIDHHNCLQ